MDVEDLILIRGFSKLAICKSRLTAQSAGGGKGSVKPRGKAHPSTARSLQPPAPTEPLPAFNSMNLLLPWGKREWLEGCGHSAVPLYGHGSCRYGYMALGPHGRVLQASSADSCTQGTDERVGTVLWIHRSVLGTPILAVGWLHQWQHGSGTRGSEVNRWQGFCLDILWAPRASKCSRCSWPQLELMLPLQYCR